MDQAVKIIQDRVNRLGVAEPDIQRQGSDKISVQLPGIANPEEALRVIGKTAVLEFFDVKQFGTPYATQEEALKAAGVASADQLPAGTEIIHWPITGGNTTDQWFVVTTPAPVNGGMLKSSSVGYDQNNQPKVDMQFDSEGSAAFAEITGKLADTAQITGENQLLAIVLDGEVAVGAAGAGADQRRPGRDHRQVHPCRTPRTWRSCSRPVRLPVELKPVSQNTYRRHSGQVGPQPGPLRRGHRPAADHGLHDRLLPSARRGRQHRPHHLRGAVHRHPQRHRGDHDPAGHRRHDPHPRHGRRCQRAHLRAHARRGSCRQDHRRCHQRRLQEGASGRSSTAT